MGIIDNEIRVEFHKESSVLHVRRKE